MSNRGSTSLTALILYATALGVVDSLIPRPLPFMKLGLANVAAVIAVVRFGFLRTMELNLLRAIAVALITGLLTTPSFVLSVSGAVASTVAMASLRKLAGNSISAVGLSISGAVASLWMQLLTAGLVLPGLPLQNIILLLTVWGMVSGAVTGMLAQMAMHWGAVNRVLHNGRG